MLPIQLNQPWYDKEKNEIHYVSGEVARVLSMTVPVAVVLQLPRHSNPPFGQASTDLLLYFPTSSQVSVFEETVNDPRRTQKGCDIRYYGTFDAFPTDGKPRVKLVTKYRYVLDFMPFLVLHGAPCPSKSKAIFKIECGDVGVSGIEVVVNYDNENREKESIELVWYDGGNESTAERKHIATWYPSRSKDRSILTWATKPNEGAPWAEQLAWIKGYMEPEEEIVE